MWFPGMAISSNLHIHAQRLQKITGNHVKSGCSFVGDYLKIKIITQGLLYSLLYLLNITFFFYSFTSIGLK
jgi:hypothetical protein